MSFPPHGEAFAAAHDDLRIEKIIAQHEAAEQERLLNYWLDEAEIALALGQLTADLDLPRAAHATLKQE